MEDKVFILGSGFSKAICNEYPTLKELTKNIEKMFNADETFSDDFFKIPSNIRSNIEDVLTYLSADLPWKSIEQKLRDKALYFNITNKISAIFYNLDCKLDESKYGIIGEFISKYKINTITFNYDLLLEELLFKHLKVTDIDLDENISKKMDYQGEILMKMKCLYKLPMKRTGNINKMWLSAVVNFDILKLHGSMNWMYNPNDKNEDLFLNDVNDFIYNQKEYLPYIIPPVLDKNGFYTNKIIRLIWDNAYQAVKNAKEIYVIGYSFPKTDVAAQYLLEAATLPTKTSLLANKTIHLVNLEDVTTISKICKANKIEVVKHFCDSCKAYRGTNEAKAHCLTCSNTPLDKFIEKVIKPPMNID